MWSIFSDNLELNNHQESVAFVRRVNDLNVCEQLSFLLEKINEPQWIRNSAINFNNSLKGEIIIIIRSLFHGESTFSIYNHDAISNVLMFRLRERSINVVAQNKNIIAVENLLGQGYDHRILIDIMYACNCLQRFYTAVRNFDPGAVLPIDENRIINANRCENRRFLLQMQLNNALRMPIYQIPLCEVIDLCLPRLERARRHGSIPASAIRNYNMARHQFLSNYRRESYFRRFLEIITIFPF